MQQGRDIFLCHAHGDKALYVRPLIAELRKFGISYWLDEGEIRIGDHITQRISEGLRQSRFVLVLITEQFLGRNWPQVELESALNKEAATGEIVVLPILAVPEAVFFQRYPLLRDKSFLRWTEGCPAIAEAILHRLGSSFRESWSDFYPVEYVGPVWIRFHTRGDHIGLEHRFRVQWGPWLCEGSFTPESAAICLVTMKGPDTFAIPVFVHVEPGCVVSLGTGSPPCEQILDVNRGWCGIEGDA